MGVSKVNDREDRAANGFLGGRIWWSGDGAPHCGGEAGLTRGNGQQGEIARARAGQDRDKIMAVPVHRTANRHTPIAKRRKAWQHRMIRGPSPRTHGGIWRKCMRAKELGRRSRLLRLSLILKNENRSQQIDLSPYPPTGYDRAGGPTRAGPWGKRSPLLFFSYPQFAPSPIFFLPSISLHTSELIVYHFAHLAVRPDAPGSSVSFCASVTM